MQSVCRAESLRTQLGSVSPKGRPSLSFSLPPHVVSILPKVSVIENSVSASPSASVAARIGTSPNVTRWSTRWPVALNPMMPTLVGSIRPCSARAATAPRTPSTKARWAGRPSTRAPPSPFHGIASTSTPSCRKARPAKALVAPSATLGPSR